MKATITLQGDIGSPQTSQRGKTVVNDVTDLAAAQQLNTDIELYSNCVKSATSVTDSDYLVVSRPGLGANVDRKGVIVLQEVGTGKIRQVTIPAIKGTATTDEEGGERVIQAVRDDIASKVGAATGKTFVAVDGYVIQPK